MYDETILFSFICTHSLSTVRAPNACVIAIMETNRLIILLCSTNSRVQSFVDNASRLYFHNNIISLQRGRLIYSYTGFAVSLIIIRTCIRISQVYALLKTKKKHVYCRLQARSARPLRARPYDRGDITYIVRWYILC